MGGLVKEGASEGGGVHMHTLAHAHVHTYPHALLYARRLTVAGEGGEGVDGLDLVHLVDLAHVELDHRRLRLLVRLALPGWYQVMRREGGG